MMATYALIHDDQIVNMIVWDGEDAYTPAADIEIVAATDLPEGAGIGWSKDQSGNWIAPEIPAMPADEE
jgi:hypothetical protein